MKRKKLLALLGSICLIIVTAALPFIMAACPAPPAPPEEKPTVPKPEEVVRLATALTSVYTDAYSSLSSLGWPIYVALYDGLTSTDWDGNPEPGLAKSWTIGENSITFHLRSGIKFHNGDALTADDVVYTWERLSKETTLHQTKATMLGMVDRVEASGPYEVIFYVKGVSPLITLPFNLTAYFLPIIPKDYTEEIGEENFRNHPIGTGPFKFAGGDLRDYIYLEANEDYWNVDKMPRVKRIEVQYVEELDSRIARILAGEVDYIDGLTIDQAQELSKRDERLEMVTWDTARILQLQFSNLNPASPWAKKEVRWAMSYAIDREALAQTIWGGRAQPANSIVTDLTIGWKPLPPIPYDPEKAKQLLAEAGYPDGFSMKDPFITYRGCETAEAIFAALASGWKEIGIDFKYAILEEGLFVKVLEESRPETGIFYALSVRTFTMEEVLSKTYNAEEGFQSASFDDYLTAALEEARQARTPEEYEQILQGAVQHIYDESMTIPILEITGISLMDGTKIKSFPHSRAQRAAIYFWSIELE